MSENSQEEGMVLCEGMSRMLYSIVSRPLGQATTWMFRHSPKLSGNRHRQQG